MKVITTDNNRFARLECSGCNNILEITPNDVYTGFLIETKYVRCPVCGKKQKVNNVVFYDKDDARGKHLIHTKNW